MSEEDAAEMAHQKDHKEMMKAFLEITEELRDHFVEIADAGVVDDDEVNIKLERWLSDMLAQWRQIYRTMGKLDSGASNSKKAPNKKRKLVHEVLADLVKQKFARIIPDLRNEKTPPGSSAFSGQFQSCESQSQRSGRSRCSSDQWTPPWAGVECTARSDQASVPFSGADVGGSDTGSRITLTARGDTRADRWCDFDTGSTSSRGWESNTPWRGHADRRGAPYRGGRGSRQSASSRDWWRESQSDPGARSSGRTRD